MSILSLSDTTCRVNIDDAYYVASHVTYRPPEPSQRAAERKSRQKFVAPYGEVRPSVSADTPIDERPMAEHVLMDWYDELAPFISCGSRDSLRNREEKPRELAVHEQQIRPDDDKYYRDVRIDLDHKDALKILRNLTTIPKPNIVVIDPRNGYGHAWWRLEDWVKKSRPAAVSLYEDIQRDLSLAITGGDAGYNGKDTVHSPFFRGFRTTVLSDRKFDLNELRAVVPRAPRTYANRKQDTPETNPKKWAGGNNYVFYDTLPIGFRLLRDGHPLDQQLAIRLRTHMVGLLPFIKSKWPNTSYDKRELKDSHASIMRILRRNLANGRCKPLTPEERRAKETARKHTRRGSKHDGTFYTERAIQRASEAHRMRENGIGVTAISRELGLSRTQVYRILEHSNEPVSLNNEKSVTSCPVIQGDGTGSRGLAETETEKKEQQIALDDALVEQDQIFRGEPIKKYDWLKNESICLCGLSADLQKKRAVLLRVAAARETTQASTLAVFHHESPTLIPIWKDDATVLRLALPSIDLPEDEDWEDPFAYTG
jgi:hypothetical protein